MKSIGAGASNLHSWREISGSLASEGLDALQKTSGPLGVRLKALVGACEVRPIFEVRTRRQTFDLLLDEQPTDPEKVRGGGSDNVVRAGEVALDDSEIPLGNESARLLARRGRGGRFRRDRPFAVGGFREGDGGGPRAPTVISKYEAGLFATEQDPEDEAGPEAEAGGRGSEKE